MTSTEKDQDEESDGRFQGLMKSLNVEELANYRSDFENLSYDQIVATKELIESQLQLLFDILSNKYRAELDTPLVTPDGFPRSDIDVVSIRLIRIKIIRLRNDNKQLLKLLEIKLIEQFESIKGNEIVDTSSQIESTSYNLPFALIKQVIPQGPAYTSGLREGDTIVLFDNDIHFHNHENLSQLGKRVKSKVHQDIPIVIFRGSGKLDLILKPTDNWSGQGLLGCHVVPL